ncbi:MAG: hypothetical protein AAF670_10100 [Planctomycetota bacterium]
MSRSRCWGAQVQTKNSSEGNHQTKKKPDSIPDWQKEEWDAIHVRRRSAFRLESSNEAPDPDSPPEGLTGVCLSGGGIRSAIFNDGFLQGLSHRGVLRYVDYLCSVSGGGYIAGHLISQRDEQSEKCFHDDHERASLGRDFKTGKVNERRLVGIGGYLSRPLVFIPTYIGSLLATFALYIGGVGMLATIIAMIWRSFDNPAFRFVYGSYLGLSRFGNELLIAFLPCLGLVGVIILCELVMETARLCIRNPRMQTVVCNSRTRVRGVLFLVLLCAVLSSIAIYIGNGKTHLGGSSEDILLNRYAQVLAVIAATIQVAVFLGRDRLFRSEAGKTKRWEKRFQQTVTITVVLFFFFSMVHWMGREDISGYTRYRDPHLVVGDCYDTVPLQKLSLDYAQACLDADPNGNQVTRPTKKTDLNEPVEDLVVAVATLGPPDLHAPDPKDSFPNGSWEQEIAISRWIPDRHINAIDYSDPPPGLIEAKPRSRASFFTRWLLAADGYRRCIFETNFETQDLFSFKADGPDVTDAKPRAPLPTSPKRLSAGSSVSELLDHYLAKRRAEANFLVTFNRFLGEPSLTQYLAGELRDPPTGPSDRANEPSGAQRITAAISDKAFEGTELSEKRIHSIRRQLAEQTWPGSYTVAPNSNPSGPTLELPNNVASLNRTLLEIVLPDGIQKQSIASTMVVWPHDRVKRQRWLSIWTILFAVGLACGFLPSRVTTVFQFYRRQLSRNFLSRTPRSGGKPGAPVDPGAIEIPGDSPFHTIECYRDGLPYPLVLAATLQPVLRNGSYSIETRPFLFSPKYSGSFEDRQSPIPTKQLSLQSFQVAGHDASVQLSDAVTLSGAAVTPLMTKNRWLSVILDFFNSGIGQVVVRHGLLRGQSTLTFASEAAWILYIVAFFGGIGAAYWLLDPFSRWSPVIFLGGVVAVMTLAAWRLRRGTVGFVQSLVSAQETTPTEDVDFNNQRHFYVADGGYCDYLGVSELLRRRCKLIVVSDAGANIGDDSLGTLSRMCQQARANLGVQFFDLDHEAPIDFGRLELNQERLVHQPYIIMRVRYPATASSEVDSESADSVYCDSIETGGDGVSEATLVYCQMSITESDPLEIKQIRNLFPKFPDEPTVNQFYNDAQVEAYRNLGFHIANRLASEVTRWNDEEEASSTEHASLTTSGQKTTNRSNPVDRFRAALLEKREHSSVQQPYFEQLLDRLDTSYRLACYEEKSYKKSDIFSEAIWPNRRFAFPTFRAERYKLARFARHCHGTDTPRDIITRHPSSTVDDRIAKYWLRQYEGNADIRCAYRNAVLSDINALGAVSDSFCGVLWSTLVPSSDIPKRTETDKLSEYRQLLSAHLVCVAVACQEIHQGRPHAAFQVGGRSKLLDLAARLADRILDRAPEQSDFEDYSCQEIISDMDSVTAELIEMERSIFQGSEHISTVSFAQCMTNAWGQMARDHERNGQSLKDRFDFVGSIDLHSPLRDAFASGTDRQHSVDLIAAEIRMQLHRGMKEIDVAKIRSALVSLWYLGFMNPEEIQHYLQTDEPKIVLSEGEAVTDTIPPETLPRR